MISYGVCLSLSDLVWESLVESVLLQMSLFHSFEGWVVFRGVYVPHLLHPFTCWRTCRLFPCLGCCEECCRGHRGACILLMEVASACMPRSGLAGSYGSSRLGVLRNLLTDLHSGCASFHSHQQCRRAPLSPHPLQPLFPVNLLVMAILTAVRWSLVVVWLAFLWSPGTLSVFLDLLASVCRR